MSRRRALPAMEFVDRHRIVSRSENEASPRDLGCPTPLPHLGSACCRLLDGNVQFLSVDLAAELSPETRVRRAHPRSTPCRDQSA
jgi:hypothetical protein